MEILSIFYYYLSEYLLTTKPLIIKLSYIKLNSPLLPPLQLSNWLIYYLNSIALDLIVQNNQVAFVVPFCFLMKNIGILIGHDQGL